MPTLNDIAPGDRCTIARITATGQLGLRLMDLGFFPGTQVRVVRNAPLVDPVDLEVDGSHVSVRHAEAAHVEVETA
ncbi:FeoA family protein [Alkalidesulfovibrio alkalitolerans DSM 16529]|jgi:ferrous iron transport protein A|uniref:FeoA family protein n=1 Tax=Alkalidesulfovibrio alkalitolerans DSM 16529 TaxID=1121439 RepID=S7T6R7_9BACT|nr:FeoA family protein [Alkalidesulfovibrio alkalitolerans]EPR32762.1 FeoA family protein [Alkalidesulfovibrio alkalitolerans DSM 16529]